jgi:TATA-binding protein-associated factor
MGVLLTRVRFLRLDGSVPAAQRFSRVQAFANDPSVDVMLLTTGVGGLGLNLSSADVVIFVDHDWNPMRDLQVRS